MTVRLYRITCGSIVLLVVDLIWVLSSELTEYLFRDQRYDKPFFSAYVKTSLFTIYLLGFVLCRSWRQQCRQLVSQSVVRMTTSGHHSDSHSSLNTAGGHSTPLYSILDSTGADDDNDCTLDHQLSMDSPVGTDDETNETAAGDEWSPSEERTLSEPIWVPIKFSGGVAGAAETNSERSSGTDGTESESERGRVRGRRPRTRSQSKSSGNGKSVRFSKLTEVRQLSESQGQEALLARLSYQATLRAEELARQAATRAAGGPYPKLTVQETVKLSLVFSWLWFLANWSYQLALRYSEAGLVNLLSSTSSLFTILLSPVFPSHSVTDNFSLTKLVAVVISVASVALITATTTAGGQSLDAIDYVPVGALWALSGAFFYAAYIVLLRYKVANEDQLDIPMFFGFVGLFNLLMLWPMFFILHYSQLEVFQWPNTEQLCIVLVNGLIGTVLSEFLWLWACFLTSSLLASLSVSLTIPLTILFDVILKGVSYPRLFFIGTVPLYVSFFTIALLSHYDNWDPLAALLMKLVRHSVLRKPGVGGVRQSDPLYSEQSQSLINDNNNSSTA